MASQTTSNTLRLAMERMHRALLVSAPTGAEYIAAKAALLAAFTAHEA